MTRSTLEQILAPMESRIQSEHPWMAEGDARKLLMLELLNFHQGKRRRWVTHLRYSARRVAAVDPILLQHALVASVEMDLTAEACIPVDVID